jgi:hypothetical protein
LFPKTSESELDKKQKVQHDVSVNFDDDDDDFGEYDLTTPEGQMTMNPKLTAKAGATEARLEYNRRNARKRSKVIVGGSQKDMDLL